MATGAATARNAWAERRECLLAVSRPLPNRRATRPPQDAHPLTMAYRARLPRATPDAPPCLAAISARALPRPSRSATASHSSYSIAQRKGALRARPHLVTVAVLGDSDCGSSGTVSFQTAQAACATGPRRLPHLLCCWRCARTAHTYASRPRRPPRRVRTGPSSPAPRP